MDRTAYLLYRVAGEEFAAHGKSGHVAGTAGFNVPIPRDLASIFLVQNRIEDRLLRQTRREFAEVAGRDQLQLFRADRAIQDCCFCVHSSVYVYSTRAAPHVHRIKQRNMNSKMAAER